MVLDRVLVIPLTENREPKEGIFLDKRVGGKNVPMQYLGHLLCEHRIGLLSPYQACHKRQVRRVGCAVKILVQKQQKKKKKTTGRDGLPESSQDN